MSKHSSVRPINANAIIEAQLDVHVQAIEEAMKADVLAFCGPIVHGVEDYIRDAIENVTDRRDKLVIVLETEGGYIEVAERIANIVRRHYKIVDFVVPNFAMSAGTVLVMCGDAIHMDYFSILGPIDPQTERPDGRLIPALGYLEKYDALIQKSKKGKLSTAELTFLVSKFDPAELYYYEQSKKLSDSLLQEWLVKYKFKNWTKTETRKRNVTLRMKKARAKEIAAKLNDTKKWCSHSRGISLQVLRNDLNLQIEDFGEKSETNKALREYYKLLGDYKEKRGHRWVIHSHQNYTPIGG
ncbi:MAG TPA: serine dehydrogenasease [Candidatus Dormibacteraeota bacterium]|nr:serine dehydrogenasease [Candidatus Dormibacteraeota bacterium]